MASYDIPKMVHQDIDYRPNTGADCAPIGFLAEHLEASKQQAGGRANLEIHDKGQIVSMTFARGWREGFTEPYSGIGHRSYNEIQLSSDEDVAVSFFYRGFPLHNQTAAEAFHTMLQSAPHTLSAQEVHSIAEVLGDKASTNAFNTLSIRTENLNGKNVLLVEGRYKALQQDVYQLYVDADGTGKNVQEVFYQAPREKYLAHLKDAKLAINSIQWKKN
jgi:hypothetical protein